MTSRKQVNSKCVHTPDTSVILCEAFRAISKIKALEMV